MPGTNALKIEDCLQDRLVRLSRDGGLHILLPSGIGDTLWAMCKLRGLALARKAKGHTVTFWLPEGEQKRAGEYLQALGVQVDYLPQLTTRWVWDRPGSPPIPASGWISAHANYHLETGKRIEAWYPELPVEFPKPVVKARDKAKEPFVLCFPCNRNYMMGQLPVWDWRSMIARISRDVAPVRIVGAHADVEFIEDICINAKFAGNDHLLDKSFLQVIAAMRSKNCVGMFGVAGGPIIAATLENVRSFFFYPRHLVDRMPGTWEPPGAAWDYCSVAAAPQCVREGVISSFLLGKSESQVTRQSQGETGRSEEAAAPERPVLERPVPTATLSIQR